MRAKFPFLHNILDTLFIPINDPHSAIELYATYLKNDRQKVTPLISEMTKILTQISD